MEKDSSPTIDAGACLVFNLDDHHFGLPLPIVLRVVPTVEVSPLPDAPPAFAGVIGIAGIIVPVVNARIRFHMPERTQRLADKLIIARAARRGMEASEARLVAIEVDGVVGVRDLSGQATFSADSILPGLEHLEGLAATDLGIVLIYDLAMFLSPGDERFLDAAGQEGSG
jgi:purine-binding chemotaxis protein CheW